MSPSGSSPSHTKAEITLPQPTAKADTKANKTFFLFFPVFLPTSRCVGWLNCRRTDQLSGCLANLLALIVPPPAQTGFAGFAVHDGI